MIIVVFSLFFLWLSQVLVDPLLLGLSLRVYFSCDVASGLMNRWFVAVWARILCYRSCLLRLDELPGCSTSAGQVRVLSVFNGKLVCFSV